MSIWVTLSAFFPLLCRLHKLFCPCFQIEVNDPVTPETCPCSRAALSVCLSASVSLRERERERERERKRQRERERGIEDGLSTNSLVTPLTLHKGGGACPSTPLQLWPALNAATSNPRIGNISFHTKFQVDSAAKQMSHYH